MLIVSARQQGLPTTDYSLCFAGSSYQQHRYGAYSGLVEVNVCLVLASSVSGTI